MGDNMLSVTRNEIEDHSRKLLVQAETTGSLLERLMNFAETAQKRQQKLEAQLDEEIASKKTAEEKVRELQKECEELQDKSASLNSKLDDLGQKIGEKEEQLTQVLPAKEKEIENLKQAVTDAEGLLTGIKFMRKNIDSFRLGEGFLEEPRAVCMLPDGRVVVADTTKGLLLYSGCTELLKQVRSEEVDGEWKWPQSLAYDERGKRLIVCLLRRNPSGSGSGSGSGSVSGSGSGCYRRALAFFDLQLQLLDYLDGPGNEDGGGGGAGFDASALVSLCYSFKAGAYYVCVADRISSTIYALPIGNTKWLEVVSKPGCTLTDAHVLAHQSEGGTTELICIERRMASVHKFVLDGLANVIFRKTLATVEKPGALCVDPEDGRLFIHDAVNGKIYEFDRGRFDPRRQIGLIDDAPYSMTASNGYLGLGTRTEKTVHVFRYHTAADSAGNTTGFAANQDT